MVHVSWAASALFLAWMSVDLEIPATCMQEGTCPRREFIFLYFHTNIAYNISMKVNERLDQLIEECGGTVRTSQALKAGISKPAFYAYVKEQGLEKVAHGVYVSPDAWIDPMYLLSLRCGQAVFSHETALFFHDLTDREPIRYSITLKTGYNPSKLQADGFQVYTIKSNLHGIGVITSETPFGHQVPVYDMERTICDLLRSRNDIDIQVFRDALRGYGRRKEKDLRKLMRYAGIFHVEKQLRPYLEVLL